MRTHKDLDVWHGAIELSRQIYEFTKEFPKEETFGLAAQMRRAAVSIASNIAEGAARKGNKEFVQFLYIAIGSVSELDTQLEISRVTGLGDAEKIAGHQALANKIGKMLYGLIRATKEQE